MNFSGDDAGATVKDDTTVVDSKQAAVERDTAIATSFYVTYLINFDFYLGSTSTHRTWGHVTYLLNLSVKTSSLTSCTFSIYNCLKQKSKDTFADFNFIASTNNLSISAIVIVLSSYSQDSSSSFWQLFEFSLGRDLGHQMRFLKCRPRQKFCRLRNAWKSNGEMSGWKG